MPRQLDDASLERAIADLPLAPLPDGFVPRVMARIAAEREASAAAAARPRLGFLDLALAGAMGLFAVMAALAVLAVWAGRDHVSLAALDLELRLARLTLAMAWPATGLARPISWLGAAPAVAALPLLAYMAARRRRWRYRGAQPANRPRPALAAMGRE